MAEPALARRPRWAWPVVALLAILGLILTFVAGTALAGAPDRGATWHGVYRSHEVLIPAGPDAWRAPYNAGTGRALDENYDAAQAPLERALALVPRAEEDANGSKVGSAECDVRMNLSLVYEARAQASAEAAGDDGAAREAAAELFDRAAKASEACTTDGAGGEGSTSPEDVANQRQRAAADALRATEDTPDEQGENETDEPDPEEDEQDAEPEATPTPTPAPTLDSKQDQLEENQRYSEEELRQREQRSGQGFGTGEAW